MFTERETYLAAASTMLQHGVLPPPELNPPNGKRKSTVCRAVFRLAFAVAAPASTQSVKPLTPVSAQTELARFSSTQFSQNPLRLSLFSSTNSSTFSPECKPDTRASLPVLPALSAWRANSPRLSRVLNCKPRLTRLWRNWVRTRTPRLTRKAAKNKAHACQNAMRRMPMDGTSVDVPMESRPHRCALPVLFCADAVL
jgi:hypothetical protein